MFGHAHMTTPTWPRPFIGNIERLPHRSNFLATPLQVCTVLHAYTVYTWQIFIYKILLTSKKQLVLCYKSPSDCIQ